MNGSRKKALAVCTLIFALMTWMGCQNDKSQTSDNADKEETQNKGVFQSIKKSFSPETGILPAGTKIRVRLSQVISTDTGQSGDDFLATLDSSLIANDKTLVPAGSKIIGELPYVKDSGRVKGRAELQMTLRKIIVDGAEYDIKTHALTVQAEGSEKKDAAVIGGSAAVGAIIGAISGGGKGAAIGAGVGGGGGTAYVLTTKGKKVEFGPESSLEFTLSEGVELPVQ